MRTFIAVTISPGDKLSRAIAVIRKELDRERIRWSATDQLHLTLKFLGDTRKEDIPGLIEAIANQLKDVPVMILHLSTMGLFQNLHNPKVIWIGIEPDRLLMKLQKEIENSLIPFGYLPENRPFSPHFTLGRIKEIKDQGKLGGLVSTFGNERFDTVSVKEILFYESELKPDGPVYTPIRIFPLSAASDSGPLDDGKERINEDFQVDKN